MYIHKIARSLTKKLKTLEFSVRLGILIFGDSPNYFQKGDAIMLFSLKEKGQGLVEYAIILALIAIVVIAVMGILGNKVNNTFNSIQRYLPS